MDTTGVPIKRANDKIDRAANLHPMEHFDPYSSLIPAPHLETFLLMIDESNPELIRHPFIAKFYAAAKEDTDANDEQVIYARMCAYGFCANPDVFARVLECVRDVEGNLIFRTHSALSQRVLMLNSGLAFVMDAFGVSLSVARGLRDTQIIPTASIVRLAQLGVITDESMDIATRIRHDLTFTRRELGYASRLNMNKFTPEQDTALGELSNDSAMSLLRITNDVELVFEALTENIELVSVVSALNETSLDPESIIRAKMNQIDNTLLMSVSHPELA